MSAQWKPGDVALVSAQGRGPRIGLYDGQFWRMVDSFGPIKTVNTPGLDIRPLVVIDPAENPHRPGTAQWADWIEDQYVAQTRPPRPEEPTGLGAVVEVDEFDALARWTRSRSQEHGINWREEYGGRWSTYADLNVVRVLSEGWSE